MEIWKIIEGSNGFYAVSNLGRIKSSRNDKILKGSHVGNTKKRIRIPYCCHGLMINGKRIFQLTHRIVANHFLPNPDNLDQVNHKNRDVKDNRVENLEWVSNKENARHANKSKIAQINDLGETIKIWNGLFEIGDEGFNKPHISESIKNNTKAYGYLWQRL